MPADMQKVQEVRPAKAKSLQDICRAELSATRGYVEVILGIRQFGTDNYALYYSDLDIAIVRAKLEKAGYLTDTSVRMDDKCTKTILEITPPVEVKTVVGVVTKK